MMECPLSHLPLVDPVVAEDGYTYSRENITSWLYNRTQSPITFAEIGTRLVPNRTLAALLGQQHQNTKTIIVPVSMHGTVSDLAFNLADLFYDHSRVCRDVLESYRSLIRVSSSVPHTLIYPMAFKVDDNYFLAEQSADGIISVQPVVGATAWVDLSPSTAHALLKVRCADEAHEVEAEKKRILEVKITALKEKLASYMHLYGFDGISLDHDDVCMELNDEEVDILLDAEENRGWPEVSIGNGITCYTREKQIA